MLINKVFGKIITKLDKFIIIFACLPPLPVVVVIVVVIVFLQRYKVMENDTKFSSLKTLRIVILPILQKIATKSYLSLEPSNKQTSV